MAAGATKKGKKVQKADETVVLPVKKVKLSESSSTTHSVADSPSPSTPPLSPVKKRVSFGKSQKKGTIFIS